MQVQLSEIKQNYMKSGVLRKIADTMQKKTQYFYIKDVLLIVSL